MRIQFLPLFLIVGLFYVSVAESNGNDQTYPPLDSDKKIDLLKTAAEQEEQFVRRGVRFNDPELQNIIDRVAEAVLPTVADTFIDFRLYLIRDPSPIAFSLADGQIYLHTGLLARLESEAQLGAVIAHEAHHVAAHHHIQADDYRRTKGNVAGVGAMLLGSGWESNIDHDARTKFSDDMEFEADTGSVALIAQAGYAPAAAAQALARLRRDTELSAASPTTSFNTNAVMLERQGRLQELAEALPQQSADAAAASGDRPLQLRRVIEMTIDDYIRLDNPGTAIDLVDAMIADQPDAFLYAAKGDSHLALGPRVTHELQPLSGWTIADKRQAFTREEKFEKYLAMEGGPERLAYNLESAASAYNTAIQLDENNARAYRGLGNMYLDQKDYRQAGRNYVRYLKLAPDAVDRPYVLENLQQIKAELIKKTETD
jgi:predicted Zn-dependent protease